MKNYTSLLLLCSFLINTLVLNATVYTTISNGNWNNGGTWDANGSPGTYWGSGDQVIVNHDVTLNQNIGFAGTLTISASGSLIGNRDVALNNGAVITGNGEVSIKKLTLNSSSDGTFSDKLILSNNLTVGSGSTLITNDTVQISGKGDNNSGTVTANEVFNISGNLANNNGTITFNDKASVGGKFDNNNGSSVININDEFEVTGNVQNNSGATMNIAGTGDMIIGGNFTNNSGSTINNEGEIDTDGNFTNNGGTVQNDNIFLVDGNFTQNNGTFTNDGVMVVDGNFRVNGGGTVNGDGLIRTEEITNFGTISGSNDICRIDDSSPTTQSGGGSYSGSTSYCTESSSAALPIKLIFFNGQITKYGIKFIWKTASEQNNDYFEIEYTSDGKEYISIAKITGAGNSSRIVNYEKEILFSNFAKNGYYRLKQTDFDGAFSYSKIIYLKKEQSDLNVTMYPNPSNGTQVYLDLPSLSDIVINEIQIIDKLGNVILERKILAMDERIHLEILKGKQLQAGVYFIRILGVDIQLQKLIVR